MVYVLYTRTKLNYCKLCLFEKRFLIKSLGNPKVLSKKSESKSKCRYCNKYLIKNVTRNDSID